MAAISLARKLAPAGRDIEKLPAAMNDNWREIYDLADMIADRHIRNGRRSAFMEPAVQRLRPAIAEFDADWKAKLGAPAIVEEAEPIAAHG